MHLWTDCFATQKIGYILNRNTMSYIIMIALQIAFAYLRTLDVVYTMSKDKMRVTIVHSLLCGITLLTVYLGVSAIESKDAWMVITYIVSGAFGKYISIKR